MTGEETIIDNWISNGGADEWAINKGYIPKEDYLQELKNIEQQLLSILSFIEGLKVKE